MTNLMKFNAADLDQLMDKIVRNSIGMDDYLAAQQYRKAHRDSISALKREIEELKAEIVVLKASKQWQKNGVRKPTK